MPKCCVPGCGRGSWNDIPGLKLYRIPSGLQPFQSNRRRLWLEAMKCTHFTEEKIRTSHVCSTHFISGKVSLNFHEPDFVPSIFPKRRIKERKMNPSVSTDIKNNTKTAEVPHKRGMMTSKKAKSANTTLSVGKDIEIEWPDLAELSIHHEQLQDAYNDLQAEVDAISAQNEKLKEDLHRVLPRLSYSSVKWDEEQLLFLTGLHKIVFEWLVSQVAGKIEGVLPEPTSRDHLLMTLMKIKLGLCDKDLAYRFGVQDSFVTRICQMWLPALAAVLKPLIAWPSAEFVAESRPPVFKGKFKKCRCIIDVPEFVVARVGENQNKQESAMKYFASVTPAGAVSFLSPGYSGVTPERTVITDSAFLHLVDPQDEILANRSIPIRDELASCHATLHIPDPNQSDIEKHVWAHVQKVLGWWKKFNMLEKVIQEPYVELLDEVLIVCAVLTNLNISLGKESVKERAV